MNKKYRYNDSACFEIFVGIDEEGDPICYWVYDPSRDKTPENEKYPSMRNLDPGLLYVMPIDEAILAINGYSLGQLPPNRMDITHNLEDKFGLTDENQQIECEIINMTVTENAYGVNYPVRFDVILNGRTIRGFLLQSNRNNGQNFISLPSKKGPDGKYRPTLDLPAAIKKQIQAAAIEEFQKHLG